MAFYAKLERMTMAKTEAKTAEKVTQAAVPSCKEALQAAPTVYEVLGKPQAYEAWYKGMRQEALNG